LALQRISSGEAVGLVAARLDRVARSAIDLADILAWFTRHGVMLVALDLGIDTSSPSGRLVASVIGAVAEWERDTIAARTRDGLAVVRAEGRPTGRPAVTDRPDLTARIKTLRASGMTLQAIADVLNDERVPTLRGASAWRPSSVQTAAGYRRPPAPRHPVGLPA
jgi:DNA invertase Pin-like site-specific DNA recombinase